jgi:carbamate kinase
MKPFCAIHELEAINPLCEASILVICAGGGGIAVHYLADGSIEGVEAVIDKDLTAALLAVALQADGLLLLTDVDAVYQDWSQPEAQRIRTIDRETARQLKLPAGSMAPKVERKWVILRELVNLKRLTS